MTHRSADPVEMALGRLADGGAVVLAEARGVGRGELVVAAQRVTEASINLMARHARGIVCLALPEDRCERLRLREIAHNQLPDRHRRFAVSIEARDGVSTGISAADRARTILTAMAVDAAPGDLVKPGHVMPLIARPEAGAFGLPEAAVELTRLAGLRPGAVMCTMLDDAGDVADLATLGQASRDLRVPLVDLDDVLAWRDRRTAPPRAA
jgi:3,4-dihydroxy 2-butanone 4-phosphate synthase/GTP cyclohydrolase II